MLELLVRPAGAGLVAADMVPCAFVVGVECSKGKAPYIVAPKGTPEPIVKETYDALRDVLSKPAIAERLQTTQQMNLLMQGPQDFAKFFAREVVEWGKVVRENNIKGE